MCLLSYGFQYGGCSLYQTQSCRFQYGGCAGNSNNFFTEGECLRTCGEELGQGAESVVVSRAQREGRRRPPTIRDVCLLPEDSGQTHNKRITYFESMKNKKITDSYFFHSFCPEIFNTQKNFTCAPYDQRNLSAQSLTTLKLSKLFSLKNEP